MKQKARCWELEEVAAPSCAVREGCREGWGQRPVWVNKRDKAAGNGAQPVFTVYGFKSAPRWSPKFPERHSLSLELLLIAGNCVK